MDNFFGVGPVVVPLGAQASGHVVMSVSSQLTGVANPLNATMAAMSRSSDLLMADFLACADDVATSAQLGREIDDARGNWWAAPVVKSLIRLERARVNSSPLLALAAGICDEHAFELGRLGRDWASVRMRLLRVRNSPPDSEGRTALARRLGELAAREVGLVNALRPKLHLEGGDRDRRAEDGSRHIDLAEYENARLFFGPGDPDAPSGDNVLSLSDAPCDGWYDQFHRAVFRAPRAGRGGHEAVEARGQTIRFCYRPVSTIELLVFCRRDFVGRIEWLLEAGGAEHMDLRLPRCTGDPSTLEEGYRGALLVSGRDSLEIGRMWVVRLPATKAVGLVLPDHPGFVLAAAKGI